MLLSVALAMSTGGNTSCDRKLMKVLICGSDRSGWTYQGSCGTCGYETLKYGSQAEGWAWILQHTPRPKPQETLVSGPAVLVPGPDKKGTAWANKVWEVTKATIDKQVDDCMEHGYASFLLELISNAWLPKIDAYLAEQGLCCSVYTRDLPKNNAVSDVRVYVLPDKL